MPHRRCGDLQIGFFTKALVNWLLWSFEEQKTKKFQPILDKLPDSDYKKLISLMNVQIQKKLNEKLHDMTYVPMELEQGVIPEKRDQGKGEVSSPDHGRNWQKFEFRELLPPREKYIL